MHSLVGFDLYIAVILLDMKFSLWGFSDAWKANVSNSIQWWFVNPDTFVPGRYVRSNKFSGLLNRPSVQERKSGPALFVLIIEISGLSEPGLTNHHCNHNIPVGTIPTLYVY